MEKQPLNMAANSKQQQEEQELKENLSKIKNKIIVLSGKGGVGKSTVAVNLAVSLADKGNKVGLLDIDIHGPSIPKLLKLEKIKMMSNGNKLIPVEYNDKLKVVSIGFLMENDEEPIVWRGPLKMGVIKQFLKDVEWGELDYLVVDSPPGTGDEPLSIIQSIPDAKGAVVVTTPQDLALIDVIKSINLCHKLNIPVLGIVENMSSFTCPKCGEKSHIFKTGGGEKLSEKMNLNFLGDISISPDISIHGDSGEPISVNGESDTIKSEFSIIIENIIKNIK